MSYHAPQHRMAWEMKEMVKITISKMNQVKEKLDKSSSILSLIFETSSSWPTKLMVFMSNPPPPKESPKTAMILHPFWRLQPQQHCLTLNILWTGVLFLSLARELAKRVMLNYKRFGTIHKGRPHWRGGGGYLKSRKMRTWGREVSCQFGYPFLRCLFGNFRS